MVMLDSYHDTKMVDCCSGCLRVSLGETASSADLGGSSKYSNESFEDGGGERSRVNCGWRWVSGA